MSADPRRVKDLFGAAAAVTDRAERDALLARECGDSPELRQRLDALLHAHDHPRSALERPLAVVAPEPDRTVEQHRGPSAVGDVIDGRYKLLERIGEGGMGEVWVADQLDPIRRRVALKMIKPGMDSRSVLARFEAERQALALMDHPNVAKVFDAGTTADGRPFFVMELVKGTPITEFCDVRKLTTKERLELFVPVCQAIQHAHQKGIIHRDLKPGNVLVALHDETPVPQVIDFGVAKAVGHQLTEKTLYTGFGALVGTPAYMAPEQATFNQLDIDTRADVYALGVLLYELLAGSPPVEPDRLKRAALDEVLRLVREEEPPRPSARLSTSQAKATIAAVRQSDPGKLSALMKGELDWIVMKALEKDRTRRYETANGFAADVQRYLNGEPVQAVPPSAGYRLRKAYRRNRAAVWVAGAFVGLVTSAGLAAAYLAVRATEAERAASAERDAALTAQAEANDQRAQADRERQRAEEEKRAAEAVRLFLQDDLLRQADVHAQLLAAPAAGGEVEYKLNPTISELLDRAAAQLTPERIEKKFPGMPFVQAEVLHAVAAGYSGIMQDAKSLALLDRAIPLYLAARGPDDRTTLTARYQQALQYYFLGRREQAEKSLQSVVADLHRVFGPGDRTAFDAQIYIGRSMAEGGRPADAVRYFRALAESGRAAFGPQNLVTLIAAGHVAYALRLDRQPAAALREIVAIQKTMRDTKVRPDHPLLDAAFGELAETFKAMGKPDDAARVWQDNLDAWKQRGEPFHQRTWMSRHELALLLASQEHSEAALRLFEENVNAAHTPARSLLSYSEAKRMAVKLGREDAALGLARMGLTAMFVGQPPTFRSWWTGMARLQVGELLLKRKEYGEAEPLLTAAVADLVEFHDRRPSFDGGRQIAAAHKALAALYAATDRPADAARVRADHANTLTRLGGRVGGGQAWEVYNSGDYETAARMFELMEQSATSPEDKSAAFHGLFQSEQKLGKLDDARTHAQAAVDVIAKARGKDHRSYKLGMAKSALGGLLYELKEPAAAEPHLVAGCRMVADLADQIPSYDYPHRHHVFDHLIRILEESNRPDEAKRWAAVRHELLDKLMRKTLLGSKFTTVTVTLAGQLVTAHVAADRHDDALALYREMNTKYTPADKPAADAWLRLSAGIINEYEAKLRPDRMRPWAELRIPALEQNLDAVRKAKPAELALLRATNTLAFSYLNAGRHADAVKLAEEVIARQRADGWRTDAEMVTAYGATAKAAALAGRPDLAVEMSSAVLAAVSKSNPPPAVRAAATFDLGFATSHAAKHAEAEGHFREAVRLQTEADAKHWKAAKYKTWLGFALHDQKKYADAEPLLLEAHAEFVARQAGVPLWEKSHPLLIAERLAALYKVTNRPEKAAEWRDRREKK